MAHDHEASGAARPRTGGGRAPPGPRRCRPGHARGGRGRAPRRRTARAASTNARSACTRPRRSATPRPSTCRSCTRGTSTRRPSARPPGDEPAVSRRGAVRPRRAARRRAAGGARAARPCARAAPRSRSAARRGPPVPARRVARRLQRRPQLVQPVRRRDLEVRLLDGRRHQAPALADDLRRVGTPTGSPVSSHVPSSRRTSCSSRASSASAVETWAGGRRPVRRSAGATAQRHRDAVAGDAAPALGEVPEQRQQPAVDAVELRDRLRDREPCARSERRSTITAPISGYRPSATVLRRSISASRTLESAFQRIVTASSSGGPRCATGGGCRPGRAARC